MVAARDEIAVVVDGLTISLTDGRVIVDGVSARIRPGEILGLVGESGSGKTTVGMSLLGYARHGAQIVGGSITVDGHDILSLSEEGRRRLRGQVIAYVPQDPSASLNPALTIGRQIEEVLDNAAPKKSADERLEAVRFALEDVGLPSEDAFRKRYPHQLSGGQLQRVGIAMAVVGKPPVLVLDEPTTGLDVVTQAKILQLVRRLCSEHGIAGLYVTHDLAVVAELADRVMVLNRGKLVEESDTVSIFTTPAEQYTRALIAAAPDIGASVPDPVVPHRVAPQGAGQVPGRGLRPPSPVLRVRELRASYGRRTVLESVDLEIETGECVAIVGESGSGKTTLSRALAGLHHNCSGEILWHDRPLAGRARRRTRSELRDLQYIFQSPYSALNPRKTIAESIGFAHRMTTRATRGQTRAATIDALEKVMLPAAVADEYPNRLSGGERQRAAIARALVVRPSLVICDEITSALDVLVQASVIELLRKLQTDEGLTMMFVTHNLALVRSFADRVMVLEHGKLVESGSAEHVMGAPKHPYTQSLVRNTPSISVALNQRYAMGQTPLPVARA